jgi:hypothetical protein
MSFASFFSRRDARCARRRASGSRRSIIARKRLITLAHSASLAVERRLAFPTRANHRMLGADAQERGILSVAARFAPRPRRRSVDAGWGPRDPRLGGSGAHCHRRRRCDRQRGLRHAVGQDADCGLASGYVQHCVSDSRNLRALRALGNRSWPSVTDQPRRGQHWRRDMQRARGQGDLRGRARAGRGRGRTRASPRENDLGRRGTLDRGSFRPRGHHYRRCGPSEAHDLSRRGVTRSRGQRRNDCVDHRDRRALRRNHRLRSTRPSATFEERRRYGGEPLAT